MNTVLPESWVENVHRLALGLETLDAARATRVAHPLRVVMDESLMGLRRPAVERHPSCLHALLYEPGVGDHVNLRFFESAPPFPVRRHGPTPPVDLLTQMRSIPRRFVPRRIRYPILTLADAEAGTSALRVRRPRLFPGAAYDLDAGMTGVRGRVERAGELVRWARVSATLPGSVTIIGRAHGDDRGEFLLLLSSLASTIGDLEDPITIRLSIFGPLIEPVPDRPEQPGLDPWWDLPVEAALPIDPLDPDSDAVSAGETLPAGYAATVTRDIELPLGMVLSEPLAFTIP